MHCLQLCVLVSGQLPPEHLPLLSQVRVRVGVPGEGAYDRGKCPGCKCSRTMCSLEINLHISLVYMICFYFCLYLRIWLFYHVAYFCDFQVEI